MTIRTTPAKVNKALKAAGFEDVTIRRYPGPGGAYYYFDDPTTSIPSICQQSLLGWSTGEVVDHVRDALKKD